MLLCSCVLQIQNVSVQRMALDACCVHMSSGAITTVYRHYRLYIWLDILTTGSNTRVKLV